MECRQGIGLEMRSRRRGLWTLFRFWCGETLASTLGSAPRPSVDISWYLGGIGLWCAGALETWCKGGNGNTNEIHQHPISLFRFSKVFIFIYMNLNDVHSPLSLNEEGLDTEMVRWLNPPSLPCLVPYRVASPQTAFNVVLLDGLCLKVYFVVSRRPWLGPDS